jgi:hypothetical protein
MAMTTRGLMAGVLVAVVGAAAVLAQSTGSKPQPEPKPAQRIDQPPKDRGKMPPEMEEHMKEAQATMMPGPEHAQLQKLAGDWTVATTMEGAGMPKSESSGSATIKSALGGRFVQEIGSGEMMEQKAEHFKMWGYNNGTKKYEAVWAWTLSTSLLHMLGDSADGGKTIAWNAWYEDKPGHREEFKAKTTMKDDDHFTVEVFGGKMPDGSPGPTMTSTYSRKK